MDIPHNGITSITQYRVWHSSQQVKTLPTLSDICEKHHLSLSDLSLRFDKIHALPFCLFDMIIEGTPVLREYAVSVPKCISEWTQEEYTLENVNIALLEQGAINDK